MEGWNNMTLIVPKIILSNSLNKKNRVILGFSQKMQRVNFRKAVVFKKRYPVVVLSVSYGFGINAFGKRNLFKNEMDCKTYEDLKWGLQTFLDKDLWQKKL